MIADIASIADDGIRHTVSKRPDSSSCSDVCAFNEGVRMNENVLDALVWLCFVLFLHFFRPNDKRKNGRNMCHHPVIGGILEYDTLRPPGYVFVTGTSHTRYPN